MLDFFRRLTEKKPSRVALALGSGGARGLAHIPVLEAFDELGITPSAIAGCSMGAVMGAGYAAGMSGKEIRAFSLESLRKQGDFAWRLITVQWESLREQWREKRSFSEFSMQVEATGVAQEFLPAALPKTFEELRIPLAVVATDLHARREVVYRSGLLRRAVAGSMAIPGVLRPVEFEGRVLIDGGALHPLPFDLLRKDADIVVAVDITRLRDVPNRIPDPVPLLFLAGDIMTHSIVSEKLKSGAPDILLRPNVSAFDSLDFGRAMPILKAADPIKEELKRKLGALLGA
ncbi:MAG: patatin-like phospholipase family protein [Rhizobiales bacterium]|nr:patatin-like phospholipase family protein [Hyphomicrobiales bacterium]